MHTRDFEIIFSSYNSAIHALRVKLIPLAISLNNIKYMRFLLIGVYYTEICSKFFSVRCAADVERYCLEMG